MDHDDFERNLNAQNASSKSSFGSDASERKESFYKN